MAVRYNSHRIKPEMVEIINKTIPNRIKWFDDQKWDVLPYENDLAETDDENKPDNQED